jgi:NAD(P)-dependent dehydrogenase (short-subunit alcohol dehydrogenase family)
VDLKLKGLKAIITGGSRGIGRAVATCLVQEGVEIAFCSRLQGDVEATAASLRANGTRVLAAAVNIADSPTYSSWLVSAAAELGGCDIFIHNASSSGVPAADEEENWRVGLELDIFGASRGCDSLAPWLEKSGSGSVVFVSSTAASEVFLGPRAFNGVKAALNNYAKNLSHVWAPKGVRVNTVSPGPIYFEGGNWDNARKASPTFVEEIIQRIPIGRLGTPDEVARAIVFLASPAASFITGANLICDGGFLRRVAF